MTGSAGFAPSCGNSRGAAGAGGATADAEARKANYSKAIKMITERAYWLPIGTYVTVYGLNKQLDFKAFPDEMPRFFWAKWK